MYARSSTFLSKTQAYTHVINEETSPYNVQCGYVGGENEPVSTVHISFQRQISEILSFNMKIK